MTDRTLHDYSHNWTNAENACLGNCFINFDNNDSSTSNMILTGSNQCMEDFSFYDSFKLWDSNDSTSIPFETMDSNKHFDNLNQYIQIDNHEFLEDNDLSDHSEENWKVQFLSGFSDNVWDFDKQHIADYNSSNPVFKNSSDENVEYSDNYLINTENRKICFNENENVGQLLLNTLNVEQSNNGIVNGNQTNFGYLLKNFESGSNSILESYTKRVDNISTKQTNEDSQSENYNASERYNRFTKTELKHLNRAFNQSPYLSPEVLKSLILTLEIPELRIKVWFRNKRQKCKKTRLNLKKGERKLSSKKKNILYDVTKQEILCESKLQFFDKVNCNWQNDFQETYLDKLSLQNNYFQTEYIDHNSDYLMSTTTLESISFENLDYFFT